MVDAKTTERQREYLKQVYTTNEWRKKVNLMSPQQVSAIYLRLSATNKR